MLGLNEKKNMQHQAKLCGTATDKSNLKELFDKQVGQAAPCAPRVLQNLAFE